MQRFRGVSHLVRHLLLFRPDGDHPMNIRQLSMREAVTEFWPGADRPTLDNVADPDWLARHAHAPSTGERLVEIFERVAEHRLRQPTIIYDYPVEISPLSKNKPDQPDFVERFRIEAPD